MSERIAVGIIRKPHGVRGEASIEPWTDSADRFDELDAVTLVSPDESQTRQVRIENARAHGERALVKFAGIESPEEVQSLHNWTVEIPEAEARALEEDEYFLHDLLGLTVIDADGKERGVVTSVSEGGGGLLLNVKKPDGRTFDLPFAAEICQKIDLGQRTMTVSLPEGLDDLNAVAD